MGRGIRRILHRTPYEMPEITDYSGHLDALVLQTETLLKKQIAKVKKGPAAYEDKLAFLNSIVDTIYAQEKSRFLNEYSLDNSLFLESEMKMSADQASLKDYSNRIAEEIAGLEMELKGLIDLYNQHNPLHKGYIEHQALFSSQNP
jgi:hypothetical protein